VVWWLDEFAPPFSCLLVSTIILLGIQSGILPCLDFNPTPCMSTTQAILLLEVWRAGQAVRWSPQFFELPGMDRLSMHTWFTSDQLTNPEGK